MHSEGASPVRLGLESVPHAGAPLSEEIQQAALRALRATTPGWGGVEAGDDEHDDAARGFSMRALTGGMTNAVFRCSKHTGDNRTVLLRCYGKGTEMFFSREAELKSFKLLAERGLGPALLATLEDGRVEEYLEGRALVAEDLRRPEISALLARRLAEVHKLDLEGVSRDQAVFRELENFQRKALDLCGESYGGVDVLELGVLATKLQKWLKESVPSRKVFCHNDLQCGNIMYNDAPQEEKAMPTTSTPASRNGDAPSSPPLPPRRLSLIDYEYAGYNPRGFDLGNHFCEWMADYTTAEPHVIDLDKYPSAEERRRFCRAYLAAMNGVPDMDVIAAEVEGLVSEADAYSLTSHLLWAMWGLLQSKSDAAAAGFDYVKYAAERLRAYRHFAQLFLDRAGR